MFQKICRKTWLSPFIAVFFVAVGVSGVLMLFHLSPHWLRPVHEWGGLLLVVAGTLHLLLNWQPLKSYFSARAAVIGVAAAVVVCGGLALIGTGHSGRGHDGPPRTESGKHGDVEHHTPPVRTD